MDKEDLEYEKKVLEKYKEVECKPGLQNFYIYIWSDNQYTALCTTSRILGAKYFSEEDADEIVLEMNRYFSKKDSI